MFRSTHRSPPTALAFIDIESVSPAADDGSFPPWPLHRPVVASVLSADRKRYGQWHFDLESVTFEDGAAAVERVGHLLERRTVIGFNTRGYDLPVLALEALRHQQLGCSGLSLAWQANRYTGCHIDLLDLISGHGAARGASLAMLCGELSIPCKLDAHGSEVDEMMSKGQLDAVIRYCESDVAATLCLAALVLAFRHGERTYAGLISQFGTWVRDRGLTHLSAFERLQGCAEFDRLSLLGTVEEGIDALDHRQHLKWATNVPGTSGVAELGCSDVS